MWPMPMPVMNVTQVAAAPTAAPSATALWDGLSIGLTFLAECAILEILSHPTVRALWRQKGGLKLYLQAIGTVLLNMLVLTPLIYACLVAPHLSEEEHSLPRRLAVASCAFAIQSMGYYCVHRAMHTPALYWCHRFHHRFNRYICPVAANAVTPVEFALAYALPFWVGAKLLRPDQTTTHVFIWLTGLFNLTIHTPALEQITIKYAPDWFVTTAFHFDHHRKLAMNYAAPTLNVDFIVRGSPALDRMLACVFGKAYQEKAI